MRAQLAPAVLAALALASPPAAGAAVGVVSIPGQSFDPSRLTIVAGDTVTWRNSDFLEHDVRAADGSFDSGHLRRFGFFDRRFDNVGSVPYLCTIHPFMRGQVDVLAALLSPPPGSVLAGHPVHLQGRAGAGATSVALERRLADGSWRAVGTTAPGADAAFAFVVTPDAPSTYRAVTVAGPSAAVTVNVVATVAVGVTVRMGRRQRLVDVATRPAAAHALATLERYSRWHYMWRRLAHARLGARGQATFRLPFGARGLVRIVLRATPHGPPLATSAPVRVKNGKPAVDPLLAIVHGSMAAASRRG
jgi:plastocyanin